MLNARGNVEYKHVVEVGLVCDRVPAASTMLRLEIKGMLYTGCNRRNGPNFGRVFLM